MDWIIKLVKRFSDFLESRMEAADRKRREAWLSESSDIFELERRVRELDRRQGGSML